MSENPNPNDQAWHTPSTMTMEIISDLSNPCHVFLEAFRELVRFKQYASAEDALAAWNADVYKETFFRRHMLARMEGCKVEDLIAHLKTKSANLVQYHFPDEEGQAP